MYTNIINKINVELKKVFNKLNYDESLAYISISNKIELADYQINSCFNIAKVKKCPPIDIAKTITNEIKNMCIDGIKAFSSVTYCLPGFVNLKLNDKALYLSLDDIIINKKIDVDNIDKNLLVLKNGVIPKCILLDYGGANVAKPLHVGHLRVAIIGEALKNLYKKFGINTIADVHLGDFGLQMGLVIEELKDENKVDNFTINDLEIIYPKASLRAKGDETKNIMPDIEFNERAHRTTKNIQDNIEPDITIWKKILEISIEDLKKRYAELNVFFDYYYGESTVKDIMKPMVDDFIKSGICYESNGAYVVDVKEDIDKKEMPPCILRKSDGAALYATSDVATIKFREENFDADEYIYVVDKRQTLHLEQCFRTAKKTGILKRDKYFYHVAVGTMNGSDGRPFKSRDGGVVKLETLINEAKEKALIELKNNNRNLEGLDENDIARKIGIAALKYGDLSNSPTRDYIFDINKFLSFEGNTGPYILYTIVRIKSIFEKLSTETSNIFDKGNILDILNNVNDEVINDVFIHNILIKSINYIQVLIDSYKNYDVSIICKYIYELSNDFNSFYHEHNIKNETNIFIKNFYISVLHIVDTILRDALNLLAIDVPDKM